jgi:hypothetical protein
MAKPVKNIESASSGRSSNLPVIIETIFTLSKLTVVLVGVIVMVLTFANGNPYWVAMLRGGITVFVLGLLVWFISWFTSKGVIESAKIMLVEANENEQAAAGNSMDTNA